MLRPISSFKVMLHQHPKYIFLLDGLGACISTITLFMLCLFYKFVGLPQATLFMLAIAALIFALYSLSCYFLVANRLKPYLLAITTINTLYSIVTASLIIQYYQSLTFFGLTYFVLELVVLCLLIALEVKTLLRN